MSAFDAWADAQGLTWDRSNLSLSECQQAFDAGIEHERRQQWRAASLARLQSKLLVTTDPSKKLDYRRHYDTDIRVTFERVRQEMEARRA